MRSILILLSFLCLSVFAQDTLKIMTYNLEGMKPGTDPETRLKNIIVQLKDLDPDIIGLQEINEFLDGKGNQGQRIADSLSAFFNIPYAFYQSATHLAWNNQFRESIGIISKYPVRQKGFLQLPSGVFPRKVVWNYIDTPLGMVNFFNTHLSFNSSSVRVQQVQQIIPFITQQESSHPGIGTILTGDFNDPPTAPSIQLLTHTGTDTFFIDTFGTANPGSPGYTVPSSSPNTRIDYIFLKNTGNLTVVKSRIVMNQPYSDHNYSSDHLGVLTWFTLTPVGVKSDQQRLPEKPQLKPNYPNPFNPVTNIEFKIENLGMVTLKVYDLLGRGVKTLLNRTLTPGSYTVQWDGTDNSGKMVASGVYFYRITTEKKFVQTRKMILLH